MIRTPPHKQTNPAKAAGQILTLGDYIKQKTAHDPKKLTFKLWVVVLISSNGGQYGRKYW